MKDTELIIQSGFEARGRNHYTRHIQSIDAIMEDKGDSLVFIVPCSPSMMDREFDLNEYLRTNSPDLCGGRIWFSNGRIDITCNVPGFSDTQINEKMNEIINLLDNACVNFDLMSVCLRCGRVAPSEVRCKDDEVSILCGVCISEDQLEERKQKALEKFEERSKQEYSSGGIQTGPLLQCIKGGFIAGLIACAVGTSMLFLSLAIPLLIYPMFIPGIVAGILSMRNISYVDYLKPALRVSVTALSCLLSIMIFSFIGPAIISSLAGLLSGIDGREMMISSLPMSYFVIMNLVFGNVGFFGSIVYYLCLNR